MPRAQRLRRLPYPSTRTVRGARETYKALVKKLPSEVKQSATISSETVGETDAICFSVYRNKAYFLNMDTRHERTFDYVLDGKQGTMTLKPCEIRILPRKRGAQTSQRQTVVNRESGKL